MNKLLTIIPLIAGAVVGAAVSYSDDNQLNRHMISHTVAHVTSSDPDDSFSDTLPLRLELTLKENSRYDVYAVLPKSRVGYTGSGRYELDSDGVFFAVEEHEPLDIEPLRQGMVEQLFVRPGSFDGHMKVAKLGENSAALVGHKVVLHMTY
ncbi:MULTISPECIES: hypothetical protein [Vibrio]|uniref:hypothetical protein n=1 Tax=Vibrio TaxID=662 RepID=UPI0020751E3F|nr:MULTISPECIES: hypothetical protein [Vibrio]USD31362.1 hypothetical protein J8Z27_08685 [Vibrio sp. SCSIO 43186]USD44407.1 hypothetical protein J4N38_09075 [Vibrio sp. SCSIO 43145]USD68485.1 hypothetical protein J4N41_08685 [Vibrio sp. SCSIO 43139]USD96172.1 hypothetical protein CTT30_08805 [Vibrio coralliilyticus]